MTTLTTNGEPVEYYAQSVGTTRPVPIIRVSRATRPPTRWCPFCDHASQVSDHHPVCPKCHAMFLTADAVEGAARVANALGRPLVIEAPEPEEPELVHKPGMGFDGWSFDDLADRAEKAKAENDITLLIEIAEEIETRQAATAWAASHPGRPVEPVAPLQSPEEENETDAMSFHCPTCDAAPGTTCTTTGGNIAEQAHAARGKG